MGEKESRRREGKGRKGKGREENILADGTGVATSANDFVLLCHCGRMSGEPPGPRR